MRVLILRASIVFFWAALILGILYFPELKILPSQEKSINVFAWGDILEPSIVAEFEQKTGITVRLNYYASNEELIVKLKATGGEGYDLIVPSDYSVKILRSEGLLKELDHGKLDFLSRLNPMLLNHPFDPYNRYSIPFEWEIFVLGYDQTYFQKFDPSWRAIFDPEIVHYRIGMINDPVQAIETAAFYLYGPVKELSPDQLQGVIRLLSEQKKWVAAYADARADYFLASKNCPVVLSSSSYIWRTMRRFPFVRFAVPKEGTFATIENFCIPKDSKKENYTYEFINFLYSPESTAAHYNTFGVFPASLDVLSLPNLDAETRKLLGASPETFKQFHFTEMLTSQQAIRDAWVQIKSSGE